MQNNKNDNQDNQLQSVSDNEAMYGQPVLEPSPRLNQVAPAHIVV